MNQNPWDNTISKLRLENMNDAHFYQSSYAPDESKLGLVARIVHSINRELMILRCRLATVNRSPSLMVDMQCDCLES